MAITRVFKVFGARIIIAGLAIGAAGAALAQPSACQASLPFPGGVAVVKALRVYTTPSGESDVETVDFNGESKAYFKPGELFTHTNLGGAEKVQLVSGPADVVLPPHPTPYREMFLTLQGSSTVVLKDGREFPVGPGTLVIFDDKTSRSGHAGRTGPCGYVALNIVPTAPKP
jgi:hypothetical protein